MDTASKKLKQNAPLKERFATETSFPRGRNTDVVVVVLIPVVVDVETALVEVADDDVVAVRRHMPISVRGTRP